MAPTVIGLNRTSDASFCLLHGSNIEMLVRKERLNRRKHAWGAIGDVSLYLRSLPSPLKKVDAVVECFSSDQERALISEYRRELEESLPSSSSVFYAEISHHYAHAYSAYYPSPFDEAAVLIADNRGSPQDLVGDTPLTQEGQGVGSLEVITAFVARAGQLQLLRRQWWDRKVTRLAGLGMFYSHVSRTVFSRGNREGVLMGLSSLGRSKRLGLPLLEVDGISVQIPESWMTLLADSERFSFFAGGPGCFSDCADLAAAAQEVFEEALLAVARHLREMTDVPYLVYAGGCALNCSANARLFAESGFSKIFIPPACDDAGTALGCALFGLEQLGGDPTAANWAVDYLGPLPQASADDIRQMADGRNASVSCPPDLPAVVASLLERGEIVAVFSGRSESGPRALGNRSILADPRYEVTRGFINQMVKGREWFRPFAPVTRLEDSRLYFEIDEPSPFMQRKCSVRSCWRRHLAAVCHVDGSARVQTVTKDQNPFLYELLGRSRDRTGIGILLNTSFNGHDEPIVETLSDAFEASVRLPIHSLVVPPFLVKLNKTASTHLRN